MPEGNEKIDGAEVSEKKGSGKKKEELVPTKLTQKPIDPNKKVPIKLFKDNQRYKEPLPVFVGEYSALIPRGKEVMVPYFVKKHLDEMAEQDANTATMIEGLVEDYEKKAKELGV